MGTPVGKAEKAENDLLGEVPCRPPAGDNVAAAAVTAATEAESVDNGTAAAGDVDDAGVVC
ncbi:hypothetical protein IMZ48_08040 [Candidatus Bathyarchaeota archaeon]|nr:hypothetical protein [Candidatus Bathyarchaeota archaeon]